MDGTVDNRLLGLSGMNIYRHDRVNRSGGGICLYARSDFSVTELSKSDPSTPDGPEYIIYRIHSSSLSVLFATVYRPLETSLPTCFLDNLSQFIPQFSHVIVTGDFNINMLTPTANSVLFRRHISNKSLHLVESLPTHHTIWSDGSAHHTWLDLFLLKDPSRLVEYRKSPEPFTYGHDFIELDYSLFTPPPPPIIITSRNLNRLQPGAVSSYLKKDLSDILPLAHLPADARPPRINISPGLPPTQVNFFAISITNAITRSFDALAPLVTFTTSPRNKPWVTADIRRLMAQRRRLYRVAYRSPSPSNAAAYRRARNEVCSRLSTAKNNFIASRINRASSVSDKWRELRKLGLGSQSSSTPFKYFTPDALNSHFSSVCGSLPPLTDADVAAACGMPINDGLSSFVFSNVTPADVKLAIDACTSSSIGADGISSDMLRLSCPAVLPYLSTLINESFETELFPCEWKKALIVPLLKVTPPKSLSDVRPIALLSSLSKIIEHIVHKQLSAHLSANRLFDPRQSGYLPNFSTQTALLGVLEDVRENIDNRKLTGLLAFDFSKAFDTLPHSLLLCKLRKIGCSEGVIKWFGSYLGGRTQAVRGEGAIPSEWLPLHTGFPQGSILGPLLFSIFILDLPTVLTHSKYMLYADDLQIYASASPTPDGLIDLSLRLSQDADAVVRWSRENGLKINARKTAALLLGSASYLHASELASRPPILVDNVAVPYSASTKSLGVTICPTLNWEEHINHISRRVFSSLHSLRYYNHALTRSLRKQLVESLIFPHFDYACVVYHHLTFKQNQRLHRLLNACVRYVYGNIPWRSSVTPYRLALGWLSVARRREYFIGSLAFKVSKFNLPEYLSSRFVPTRALPELRRSQRTDSGYFIVPRSRTESLRSSFSHTAIRVVNSLKCDDLSSLSVDVFQSRLRDHLFSLDLH